MVRAMIGSKMCRGRWVRGARLACCLAGLLAFPMGSALAAASAVRTPAVDVVPNVPYGGPDEPELVLDVYRPVAGGATSPVVIAIHGGGWVGGDKLRFAPQSRALAKAGFLVLDINYTLDTALGPGYPRQVDDVRTALRWTQRHARSYGGDPQRIAVVGGSAGGYLAAMLGVTANDSDHAPVRAVASLSGPMDLVAIVGIMRAEARACTGGPCMAALRKASTSLQSFLGCAPLQCPEDLLVRASPVAHVTSASPPFFLANSTEESIPVDQAVTMANALRAQSVVVDLHLLPGSRHSVEYLPEVARPLLTFLRAATVNSVTSTATSTPDQVAGPSRRFPQRLLAIGLPLGLALAAISWAFLRTRSKS
jgi:acetyl esterase/lipase